MTSERIEFQFPTLEARCNILIFKVTHSIKSYRRQKGKERRTIKNYIPEFWNLKLILSVCAFFCLITREEAQEFQDQDWENQCKPRTVPQPHFHQLQPWHLLYLFLSAEDSQIIRSQGINLGSKSWYGSNAKVVKFGTETQLSWEQVKTLLLGQLWNIDLIPTYRTSFSSWQFNTLKLTDLKV